MKFSAPPLVHPDAHRGNNTHTGAVSSRPCAPHSPHIRLQSTAKNAPRWREASAESPSSSTRSTTPRERYSSLSSASGAFLAGADVIAATCVG